MGEKLDEKTAREFKFSFKQINFWTIHDLYMAMKTVHGEIAPRNEIELVNEKGERWNIRCRDEMRLFSLFNKPNVEYTAIVRGTEGELRWYQSVFSKYSDYTKYFLAGLEDGKDREAKQEAVR
jgi:hypothetical protein